MTTSTASRIAEFVLHGGQPLADFEQRILRRAAAIAGDDPQDIAAVVLVAGARS